MRRLRYGNPAVFLLLHHMNEPPRVIVKEQSVGAHREDIPGVRDSKLRVRSFAFLQMRAIGFHRGPESFAR